MVSILLISVGTLLVTSFIKNKMISLGIKVLVGMVVFVAVFSGTKKSCPQGFTTRTYADPRLKGVVTCIAPSGEEIGLSQVDKLVNNK